VEKKKSQRSALSLLRERSEKMKTLWKSLLVILWFCSWTLLQFGLFKTVEILIKAGFFSDTFLTGIVVLIVDLLILAAGGWLIWRRYK